MTTLCCRVRSTVKVHCNLLNDHTIHKHTTNYNTIHRITLQTSRSELESILEPLRDTFQSKLKDICPIGQEVEKVQELKRSAMRAVVALSKIPDIGNFHLLKLSSCGAIVY